MFFSIDALIVLLPLNLLAVGIGSYLGTKQAIKQVGLFTNK